MFLPPRPSIFDECFRNADGTPVYIHGAPRPPRLSDRLQTVLLMALIAAVCAVPLLTALAAGAAR